MPTSRLTRHEVPGPGAEDVAVGLDGRDEGFVFTGTEDGSIVRVSHDGSSTTCVAHTGGRPLGIEWVGEGELVVCDARRGLLRVDTATGTVRALAGSVGGVPMQFCNNAAVAMDGTIWFSDSSTRFGIDRWKDEVLQGTRTGRLLRLDPGSTEPEPVLDGLDFANGVALAADESFVAVAETGGRTVIRLWLTGPKAGTRDDLVAGLPGYPDNISRGSDGLIWVTIASPVDPVVTALQMAPAWLAGLATRIPAALQPQPKRTVRVQAYDATGTLVHDLGAEATNYHMVTGVREHEGRVWLGSLHEPAIAVLDM